MVFCGQIFDSDNRLAFQSRIGSAVQTEAQLLASPDIGDMTQSDLCSIVCRKNHTTDRLISQYVIQAGNGNHDIGMLVINKGCFRFHCGSFRTYSAECRRILNAECLVLGRNFLQHIPGIAGRFKKRILLGILSSLFLAFIGHGNDCLAVCGDLDAAQAGQDIRIFHIHREDHTGNIAAFRIHVVASSGQRASARFHKGGG